RSGSRRTRLALLTPSGAVCRLGGSGLVAELGGGLAARRLPRARQLLPQPRQLALVLSAELGRRQEVGAAQERAAQRLAAAPGRDVAVVPRQEDLRDAQAAELGRAGVLRVVEQAGGERVLAMALLVTQRAGQQARDGLDHAQRRQLAAHEDEVSDRHLAGDEALHPRVEALVAGGQQADVTLGRQLRDEPLGEPLA